MKRIIAYMCESVPDVNEIVTAKSIIGDTDCCIQLIWKVSCNRFLDIYVDKYSTLESATQEIKELMEKFEIAQNIRQQIFDFNPDKGSMQHSYELNTEFLNNRFNKVL